jgi:predicted permease
MPRLRALLGFVRAWRRRSTFETEMAEEMRLHLEQRVGQHLRAGMSPHDARLAALRAFGGVAQIQDACRDQRRFAWLDGFAQDLRHGVRQLTRQPGFAAIAVLTFALGIGANTVVFSVAKAVLLRPLGFDAPDQLVWLRLTHTGTGATEERLSWRDIEDIRGSTRVFASLAMFGARSATWEQDGRLEELPALGVSPNLADVLRVRPVLGRSLLPSDAEGRAAPVVLVSHELWQTRFGGTPDIIGRHVRLDEVVHTVVGVLPPGLQFPLARAPSAGTGTTLTAGLQAFWFPLNVDRDARVSRGARMFLPIGRLKPDVTPEAARAELVALGRRLAADHPETNRGWTFDLVSVRDQVLGRTRYGIPVLAAAVAAVLLICCVNLASLLLARGVSRQGELTVRATLGAGRRRLVQALLLETAVLALLGGAVGLLLAEGAVRGVRVLTPANVPFIRETTVDGAAVLFTAGLALMTAFVCGLWPALRQSRGDAGASARPGHRATGGPQIRSWQRGLLVGQIAAVLVLLTSAGLLLESFRRLIGQDLGYQPRAVVALDLRTRGFQTNESVSRMYRALHARLTALPGVDAVGTISSTPLTGKWTFDEKADAVDRPLPEADRPSLSGTFVAYDYFQAMGIGLLDGRHFRDADLKDDDVGRTAIINEAAATLLFPGRPAVGGRFTLGTNRDRVLEVVGVVRDTRDVRLDDRPQPRFYLHYAFGDAQVVVRSRVASGVLMPLVRDAVHATDRRVIVHEITAMTDIVAATVAERRFLMIMLVTYAAVALGIAAVGTFGVAAFQVAQRTREFGIRLALGASPRGLLGLVLMQTSRTTVAGLAIGLVCSLATSRLLASQLFGVSPHEPWLLTMASVGLLLVTLLASLLPARRATRIAPLGSLRCE